MASASAGTRSALSWMPRSAPMLIAFRICSCTASGPSETMTTSPWFDFSLSRSAASTAQRSKSFTSYLSPASSYDAPSFPTEKRTSMTGTRLMQTAIFTARSPCEKVHIEGSRDSPRCAGAVDVASGRYRAHYVVEPHARAAVRAAIDDRPFYPPPPAPCRRGLAPCPPATRRSCPTFGADAGHEDVRGGDAASELPRLQQMQQAMSNVVTQVGQQATTPIRNIRG